MSVIFVENAEDGNVDVCEKLCPKTFTIIVSNVLFWSHEKSFEASMYQNITVRLFYQSITVKSGSFEKR